MSVWELFPLFIDLLALSRKLFEMSTRGVHIVQASSGMFTRDVHEMSRGDGRGRPRRCSHCPQDVHRGVHRCCESCESLVLAFVRRVPKAVQTVLGIVRIVLGVVGVSLTLLEMLSELNRIV